MKKILRDFRESYYMYENINRQEDHSSIIKAGSYH